MVKVVKVTSVPQLAAKFCTIIHDIERAELDSTDRTFSARK